MGITKYNSGGGSAATLNLGSEVFATTTGNVTLSGLGIQSNGTWIDILTSGQRILVKNNTSGATNGIYVASSGSWSRASDFNSTSNILIDTYFLVAGGSAPGAGWLLITDPPYVVGTTDLEFTEVFPGSTSGSTLSWNPPSSNTDGMWMTYDGLYARISGKMLRINSADALYYAYTSTTSSISNTTTQSSMFPGAVSLSVSAQNVNNIINVTLDGFISFANLSNSITFNTKLGNVILASASFTGTNVIGAAINTPYHFTVNLKISSQLATGSSATVSTFGIIDIITTTGSNQIDIVGNNSVNTSLSHNLDCTATWSSAAINNSIFTYMMQVQHINSIQ